MKKIIIGIFSLLMCACTGSFDGVVTPEIVMGKLPKGVIVDSVECSYNSNKGDYEITANLKNGTNKPFEYVQVTADLQNAKGETFAQPIGGPDVILPPGTMQRIDLHWVIVNRDSLPTKVVISADL